MTAEAFGERAIAGDRPRTPAQRMVRFVSRTPVHIALAVVALIWLLPSIGLFVTSFRPRPDIQTSGWWETLTTLRLTTNNYSQVINAEDMGQAFLNSVIISVPSTLLPLFVAALAAFAFAWIRFPLRDTTFLIVVGLLMVPVQLTLIPLLQLFREFELVQSYVASGLRTPPLRSRSGSSFCATSSSRSPRT